MNDGMNDVLAALDLGTNSFHMVVARRTGDEGFEIVSREKEVVRLGHGGTDMKEMSPEAMDRAIACLQRMRRIAESHGVVALRAVATSATREAANADVFIRRASEEAQVEIEVISGLEEARLIHLGVLQAVPVFEKRALFVDIGGGSTEILIGERGEMLAARSFKLGAVRLTDRFFPEGATSGASVTACREYVRSVLTHFDRKVEDARLRGRGRLVGHGRDDRPHGARRTRRGAAADLQLLRVHGQGAALDRRQVVLDTHPLGARQARRARGQPGRHRPGRRADPRRDRRRGSASSR